MGVHDYNLELCRDQAITGVGLIRSTFSIPLSAVRRNIGVGTPLFAHYIVTQAFAGASQVQFAVGVWADTNGDGPYFGVGDLTILGSSEIFDANLGGLGINTLPVVGNVISVPIGPIPQRKTAVYEASILPALANYTHIAGFITTSGAFSTGRVSGWINNKVGDRPRVAPAAIPLA